MTTAVQTDWTLRWRQYAHEVWKWALNITRYVLLPSPGSFKYACQVGCSVILSMLAAYYFHIEDPYWAPTAAMVVTNRIHGQVLSKSMFRLLGTFCGMIMGIFLVGAFSQAADVFILCFALWMAICTYVSTLLRNFRTYSAALSGYTAAIIVFGSISAPDHVLELALARVAAVVCGISATAVTSVIFSGSTASDGLGKNIERSFDQLCWLVRDAARGMVSEEFADRCYRLAREISAIPSVIEFASVESARVKSHRANLNHIVATLMHSLTAAWAFSRSSYVRHEENFPEDDILRELRQEAADLAERIANFVIGANDELIELGRRVGFFGINYRRYTSWLAEQSDAHTYGKLIAVKNLAKALDQLSIALENWSAYSSGTTLPKRERIAYDINYKSAMINAVRSFCAVLAGGILWIECAWPSGTGVLEMLAIACSLYSSTIQPRSSAVSYLIGASIGSLIALVCYVFVLPNIDGFPLLAAVIFVVTVILVLHMDPTRPKFASRASASLVFFFISLHLSNPMSYNIAGFINNSAGMLCGISLAVLAYTLIFPVSPQHEIKQALRRLLQEVHLLVADDQPVTESIWESRMYDRLARVMSYIEMQRGATKLLIEDFFAMIRMGVEIITLRNLAQDNQSDVVMREIISDSVRQMGSIGHDNENIVHQLSSSAAKLFSRNIEDAQQRMNNYQAAASLREIAHLIREHHHILMEKEPNL